MNTEVIVQNQSMTVSIECVKIVTTDTTRDNYFQTINEFSELDTNDKKIRARQNLELQIIDCGEFF